MDVDVKIARRKEMLKTSDLSNDIKREKRDYKKDLNFSDYAYSAARHYYVFTIQ